MSSSFYIKIERPVDDVFDAIYNNEKLNGYFATGEASGPLDEGATVTWGFHDFPEFRFPVRVTKCLKPTHIVIEWESGIDSEWNQVEIVFERLDDPHCTKVKVTESGWPKTDLGIKKCVGNSGGWAQMRCALKVYLELGVNLREFYF